MFKIGICVENEKIREELKTEILKWSVKSGLRIILGTYENGEVFAFKMYDENTPDIMFFDVCHDSTETQNILMEFHRKHSVTRFINVGIFEKEDMLKMYEFRSTYISYPLDRNQIYQLAKREYERYYTDDESYVFMNRPQYIKLSLKKIMYFSSIQRKIKVVCNDGRVYEFYKQLDSVEEQLRGKRIQFIRTHQSQLVNPEFVKEYWQNQIVLKNGEKLSIPKDRRRIVRSQFQTMNIYCQ